MKTQRTPLLLAPSACALLAMALGSAAPARQAAPVAVQQPVQQKFGETVVRAEDIAYDFDRKQVVATGKVEMVTGHSRMTADKMTVQMAANMALDWAKCEGNVFVTKRDPEDQTTVTARGRELNYSETGQKASLEGGVTAELTSPRLAKPAVVTGSVVEMDLRTHENVIKGGGGAQAKVHVEPKGTEGKPAPEPIDLTADHIRMNGQTQEYVATGKPVLVRPHSRLSARTIRFTVEGDARDVKSAYAEQDVVFDGTGESGTVLHVTADHGVFTRETNEMVLTGNVVATSKGPDDPRPIVYQGKKFVYNTKTRRSVLTGGSVTLPAPAGDPKKEKPKDPGSDKK